MTKVLFFTESDERWTSGSISKTYPQGFKGAFDTFLNGDGFEIKYCYQSEKSTGLTCELVDWADVIIWWGHVYHDKVSDEIVNYVVGEVQRGKGIIFLHSSHMSKPFKRLMGTSGTLNWFESDSVKERLWTIMPNHPIASGIESYFELPNEEMYGEPFAIPTPDELIFIGWFNTGNVFRSGVCYQRDKGKIFYFQPGHETFPTYYDKNIQSIIKNAVEWAKPNKLIDCNCTHFQPLEKI